MDSENKQRVSLYLDKDLVEKADKIIKENGFKSRNEFYSSAIENFIAVEIMHGSDNVIVEKLSTAINKLSKENSKAISQGLFRFAVQLEMVMRIIAELSDTTDEEVEYMRLEAIKNVGRLKGRVHLEEIISGYYNERNWKFRKDILKPW